jgi:hypothetical protein
VLYWNTDHMQGFGPFIWRPQAWNGDDTYPDQEFFLAEAYVLGFFTLMAYLAGDFIPLCHGEWATIAAHSYS